MPRRRVIVGIGEALLAERPDREEPAGLALLVPMYAALLGHEGIAISRLGQDDSAGTLLRLLREIGVDTEHLQSDPDIATGRLLHHAPGGRSRIDSQAAYDNLQWDFDLSDVAQRADAVVFGALCRRSGQARSTIDRFLAECGMALRVFDLTNRGDGELNRGHALSGLKLCEAAVADDAAMRQLVPGAAGRSTRDVAVELVRQGDLAFVVGADEGRPLSAHTVTASWTGRAALPRQAWTACVVGLLHGVLGGLDLEASLAFAERLGRFVVDHPREPLPPEFKHDA